MSVVGIVPAGGSGERLGADQPKAFVVVAGRPLLSWSLDVLRKTCDRVVVAVPLGFEEGGEAAAIEDGATGARVDLAVGGESRSASVRNALAAAPEATIAVVHDAARPLVTERLVEECLAALEPGVDGAIAALRMSDTVKEAAPDGRVLKTLDRSTLWAIQTPQVFRADVLRRALDTNEAALAAATDDASLVEDIGGTVHVVEGPLENLKVTRAHDLRIAEALLC
jgi:2-C-methyl-D-erythritol 4-phosphate cytidylyltransferase